MSLEVRFDPAFVEEAVFLELNRATAADTRQMASAFHREREALYELADAQQREAAFQQLARRTFQALGLAELFTARFGECPRLSDCLELVVVRRVWNRKDEQVELYVSRSAQAQLDVEASATLLIALQANRCLDRGTLVAFLRHELMHVADMLDPAFAYDPHTAFGGECEPENELIRERFRALWDLWVHARMRRRQWQTILDDDARRRDVMRTFAFLSPAGQEELVTAVSQQDRWIQEALLALAGGAHVEAAR